MKVTKLTLSATIPTGQYANIQPSIEISDITNIDDAQLLGINYIKDFYERFSSIGELKENKVKTTIEKIDEVL